MKLDKNTAYFRTDDGANLYYEDHGQGQPIFLVHGWSCSTKVWHRNIAELARQFRVIALDSRGHGNSSKTLCGHQISQYARDVRALIEHIDLRDVILLGWSLGGPVVLSYWQQFSSDSRLSGIGMIDSNPFPFSPDAWNCHSLRNFNSAGMAGVFKALADDPDGFATAFSHRMFKSGKAAPEDLNWLLDELRKTPPWIAIAIYSDFLTSDYAGVLPTLSIPAIIFAGNSEVFAQGNSQGKYLAGLVPNATFVPFDDAGHMPFYEQPAKFNAALIKFITNAC